MNPLLNRIKTIGTQVRNMPVMRSHVEEIDNLIADINQSVQQPITVLVCGECKRGKSTFINAWLGQDLCPVDIDVCTAVVTIIRYGEQTKARRYFGDLDSIKNNIPLQVEEVALNQIENIIAYGTSQEDTHIVEIELPNEKLKAGITLIDSPGVGGMNPVHGFLTNQFIQQADLILFAVDTMQTMSTSELQYYAERIHPHKVTTTFMLNKCDLVPNPQSLLVLLDDIKTKVSEEAHIAPDEVVIFPVSVFEQQGLDVIEKSIPRRTLRQVLIYKEKLMQLLRSEIEAQQLIVQQQNENTQAEQQRLTELLQNLSQQIQDWSNPTSAKRLNIQNLFDHQRTETMSTLNTQFTELTTTGLNNLISQSLNLSSNGDQWLIEQLQDQIDQLSENLTAAINHTAEVIANSNELRDVFRFQAQGLSAQLNMTNITHEGAAFMQKVSPLMMGAGIASLVSTTLALPWIGIPLGIFAAWEGIATAGTAATTAQIRQDVLPKLNLISNQLNADANTAFGDMQREIFLSINEILSGLKKQAEQAKNDLLDMHNNAGMAAQKKQQAQGAIVALSNQMQTLRVVGGA